MYHSTQNYKNKFNEITFNISLTLIKTRPQESDFCMVNHQEKVWGHLERVHIPECDQVYFLVRLLKKRKGLQSFENVPPSLKPFNRRLPLGQILNSFSWYQVCLFFWLHLYILFPPQASSAGLFPFFWKSKSLPCLRLLVLAILSGYIVLAPSPTSPDLMAGSFSSLRA